MALMNTGGFARKAGSTKLSSVVDWITVLSNDFGAALWHARNKNWKIGAVKLMPMSFDFFEEVPFIVAFPISHFSVEFAPQILDRV